ncbi:Inner membrane metabolite transport protein YhjE [Corynebacterium occultum]|uniref:Inner membrane metabolite transport protein YhjE n=1 Tax=Corynebacterium occultum TaxID=2675219 RepID=A0A6B8WKT1_9CORY|nr:Inner membrane metabolite transport protein YhjE [Corynebacterium occultum]
MATIANVTNPGAATPQPTDKQRRKVLISSFLGSTVEYYDFLLYGAAAGLVFPYVFFDDSIDPFVGMILSYVILFAGYLSRPVGGLLFGHLGDRYGRKNVLFVTLMIMGVVSIAIGLLPGYATIGIAAPILLVALRVIQGIAVGGEWAGATLMAAEHSKAGSRGFAASIAVAGAPAGAVLSTLVLALFAGLPEDQFLSWGWRVPFLLSAVLVIIGLYMRYSLTESPEFEEARRAGQTATGVPMKRIFTVYPKQTIFASLTIAAPLFMQALLAVFVVPFVVQSGAIERQDALMLLTFSSFLHIFAIPAFAMLSDRFGRRRIMLIGVVISISLVFPMFMLFTSGNVWLIGLGFIVGNPIIQASIYGPVGAFLADKYAPEDRYTGVSVSYQVGSILGAGVAPIMSTWLVTLGNGWGSYNVATYFVVLCVIAGIGIIAVEKPKYNVPRKVVEAEPAPAPVG